MKRLSLTLTLLLLAFSTLWPTRAASRQAPDYILYEVTATMLDVFKFECEAAQTSAGHQAKAAITAAFIAAECPQGYPLFDVVQAPYVQTSWCVNPPGPGAYGNAIAKGQYKCSELP